MTRALCHFDNAYWLPDVAMHGYCGKTNTQSNTAFRGFGGPQGAIAIENIWIRSPAAWGAIRSMCAASTSTARTSATSRPTSSRDRQRDPRAGGRAGSQQRLPCAPRRRECLQRASPVLKRGLALTAHKFGISFNVKHFNQAGALVHIYTDGSDSREPWRHRNGPGPEHQGGAGGGA
jgi:xanthine dehydrogenase large subunit